MDNFNAISNKNNDLDDTKYDDTLACPELHLRSFRFYNGVTSFMGMDALHGRSRSSGPSLLVLYQEASPPINSLSLIENINVAYSRNKIADYIKSNINIAAARTALTFTPSNYEPESAQEGNGVEPSRDEHHADQRPRANTRHVPGKHLQLRHGVRRVRRQAAWRYR
ncbi:hypothetical protein PHYPSEUDO_003240 [Phytophthora pseudosyringae]|uniref:Uncharacterized protein n=1 Tax=Phytophthora pseudosyringae TaxID=221518 RepID=A0A8T1VV85_9STRA|nr:hypothetical protein PHYPSEUDO_003240 [Phytophthora pseudosyringae]